jgi:hypothetical protein
LHGKPEPRGESFPGTADQPLQRTQIFSAALKRINKEVDRLHKLEARTAHVGAARAALGQHRAAKFAHHPPADPTPHDGMQPGVRIRRRTRVPGSKIGSTSQATKIVQAFRDAKRQLAQSAGGELVPHSPTAMIFTRQPALEVHR